jgi:CBS domain containing-hemolysin-like protein
VEVTAKLLHPVVLALNGLGRLSVRALGVEPQTESHAHVLPAEELADMIESSVRVGVLAADPRTLRQALHFSDLHAHDVMIPRQEIIALDTQMTLEQVLGIARDTRHTRYPVYEESIDQTVGLLNVKDLVQCLARSGQQPPATWHRLVRPIPAVPESAPIEQLLLRLRQEKQHMALLVDEFGGVAGIVTVADMVRYLMGDAGGVRSLGAGEFSVDGGTSIASIEATLGISLELQEREDYTTIGGLIMAKLGRIPVAGDLVQVDTYNLTVQAMDGHRVERVLLQTHQDGSDPESVPTANA